jgi:hypothetical protein
MDRTRILAAPQAEAELVVPIRAQDQGVVSMVENWAEALLLGRIATGSPRA